VSAPLVSIILPVYRQADHIGALVEEYTRSLVAASIRYEMLLVVNGPMGDGTWDACKHLEGAFPGVRALRSDPPGWGGAVIEGVRASRGDPVCYTNSARTSAADLVQCIPYSLANPTCVVKAMRKIRESKRRRLGSLFFNLECRALFDLYYWDINGTPKVFPRRFAKLLELRRPDDLVDLEFCVICGREGYPVLEIPAFSTRRHGGASTTRIGSAVRLYAGAWRMWRNTKESSAHASST
jgi:glycosyltransferase involved in cell wall biosynthesis